MAASVVLAIRGGFGDVRKGAASLSRRESQQLNIREYASPLRLLRSRRMTMSTILRIPALVQPGPFLEKGKLLDDGSAPSSSGWAPIMARRQKRVRRADVPMCVGAGLLAALSIVGGLSSAGDIPVVVPESERAHRIEELQKQRDRIQRELHQMKQQPEGVSRSSVPRTELTDQPTRTLKESMESVPGVAVSPGAGGRAVDLTIRGSGK